MAGSDISNLVLPRPSAVSLGPDLSAPPQRTPRIRNPSKKVAEQRLQEAEAAQQQQQKLAAVHVPKVATDLFVTSRVVPSRTEAVKELALKQRGPKARVPPARVSADELEDEPFVVGLSDNESTIEVSSATPVTRKRRGSSIDATRDTQVRRTSHDGRPRAGDYKDLEKKVLDLAMTEYRCVILTREAFPDHAQENEIARMVWKNACKELSVNLALSERLCKLITNRGAHTRGELKTKARPFAEAYYEFKTSGNRKIIKRNRDRVTLLKDGPTAESKLTLGLYYKVFSDDPTKWKGLYENPLIQKLIDAMSFKNKEDEGIRFEQYFNPFPVEGFALLFTVIECSIDEWATGVRADASFTRTAYHGVYKTHLTNLQKFKERASDDKINVLVELGKKIFNRAKVHAGVQLVSTRAVAKVPLEAFDAAFREYKERMAMGEDSDSDDDDDKAERLDKRQKGHKEVEDSDDEETRNAGNDGGDDEAN